MCLGRVTEAGPAERVFGLPYHPYTEGLVSAAPTIGARRRIVLAGELPGALSPPSGYPLHTRCPRKLGAMCETEPPLERMARNKVIASPIRRSRYLTNRYATRCRSRRNWKNSTPSRRRRFIICGLRTISPTIDAIFGARK